MRYVLPLLLLAGCAAEQPSNSESPAPAKRFSIPDATSQPSSKPVVRDITLNMRPGVAELTVFA